MYVLLTHRCLDLMSCLVLHGISSCCAASAQPYIELVLYAEVDEGDLHMGKV